MRKIPEIEVGDRVSGIRSVVGWSPKARILIVNNNSLADTIA